MECLRGRNPSGRATAMRRGARLGQSGGALSRREPGNLEHCCPHDPCNSVGQDEPATAWPFS